METDDLTRKVALVTGASQGIGEAVAKLLARHGARIAAVDINKPGLDALVSDLAGAGLEACAYPADVRDSHAADTVTDAVERELGPIGILVNVAGVLHHGRVLATTDEDWRRVFDVNTTGVFNFSRAVAKKMVQRRAGAIVTVASNAAGVPRMDMGAYGSSKAATVMLTKCLGLELARYGIRCNVVCPGSTDTPMQRSLWDGDNLPAAVLDGSLDSYKAGIPLRTIAQAADIADSVLFLVSDRAAHITMHDLYVDGGAALRA